MVVCNFKLNIKNIFKIIFVILMIFVFIMLGIGIYKIFGRQEKVKSDINEHLRGKVSVISSQNYTSVLKTVHDDINTYIGMKIRFTGFVYRLNDFDNSQFVLARQMIVSSDLQAVVVGFLCRLNEAEKYSDGDWIEVEGTITKGYYHGEIPVIDIYKIKEVDVPSDEYVYPPDNSYVPTSIGLW